MYGTDSYPPQSDQYLKENPKYQSVTFLLWLCLLVLGSFNGFGQRDSSYIHVRPAAVIVPVALAGSGLIVQGRISRQLQTQLNREFPGSYKTKGDDFFPFVPGVVSLGLAASGVKGKHKLGEQIILAILSNMIAQGVTQGMKRLIRYERPDGSGFDSFPSGHTTAAFANATLLHREYGHRSVWYSVGGYAVATATGGARVINNQHWTADVLFGAGVGTGATNLVYVTYPWLKHQITGR